MCESACHVTLLPGNWFCWTLCQCCRAANPISNFSGGNNPRPKTLVDSARAHATAQRRVPWTRTPRASVNGTPAVTVSRGEGGRCRMPRTAIATPVGDGEVSTARVDDLIQRGRNQGHLSLSELRTAFEQAGIAPAEGRSILRELADAGVRLANERQEPAAKGKRTAKDATAKASTAKVSRSRTGTAKAAADGAAPVGSDGAGDAEAVSTEAVPGDGAIEAEAV